MIDRTHDHPGTQVRQYFVVEKGMVNWWLWSSLPRSTVQYLLFSYFPCGLGPHQTRSAPRLSFVWYGYGMRTTQRFGRVLYNVSVRGGAVNEVYLKYARWRDHRWTWLARKISSQPKLLSKQELQQIAKDTRTRSKDEKTRLLFAPPFFFFFIFSFQQLAVPASSFFFLLSRRTAATGSFAHFPFLTL